MQASIEAFVLLDASTSKVIYQIGDVDHPSSPCSTFKIILSLMGYDSGLLQDEENPVWEFQEGYLDFFPSWRSSQTPKSWFTNSCIWFSHALTAQLGLERMQHYVDLFQYGNRDLSGEPGKNNGITDAWLGTSLKISPLEEAKFLKKLICQELPVSNHALEMTRNILFIEEYDGFKLYGKTGINLRLLKNTDLESETGWFVGWLEKEQESYPFAYRIVATNVIASERIPRTKELLQKHFQQINSLNLN